MTTGEITNLLIFLDDLFQLGGKLLEAAIVKTPELQTAQLPDLQEMDQARNDALNRIRNEP